MFFGVALWIHFNRCQFIRFFVSTIRKKKKKGERKRTYGQYRWVFQTSNQSVYSTTYTRDKREDTGVQPVVVVPLLPLLRVQRFYHRREVDQMLVLIN